MTPEQQKALDAARGRLATQSQQAPTAGFSPEQQGALDAARQRVGGQPQQPGVIERSANQPFDTLAKGSMNLLRYFMNIRRVASRGATAGGAAHINAPMADAAQSMGMPEQMTGPSDVAGQQALTAQSKQELGPVMGNAAELGGGMATSALVPGGAFSTLGRSMATGGIMGLAQTAAQGYFDTGDLPDMEDLGIGTLIGVTGGAAGYTLGKIMTQPRLAPHEAADVRILNDNGIDVSVGQATKNAGFLTREGKSTGVADFNDKQMKAFSRAALKKAGIGGVEDGVISESALQQGFTNVGGKMDALAMNYDISDPTLLDDMLNSARDLAKRYKEVDGAPASLIENKIKVLAKAKKDGVISGTDWQQVTSSLQQAPKGGPLRRYALELRDVMDDAMEESIKAVNPNDAGAWQAGRSLYKRLMVIEEAAASQTVQRNGMVITPDALSAATKRVYGKRAYTRGLAEYDELARAGMNLVKPIKQAGGAAHELQKGLTAASAVAGGLAGTAAHFAGASSPVAMALGTGAAAATIAPLAAHTLQGMRKIPMANPAMEFSRNLAPQGGKMGSMFGSTVGATAGNSNPFSRAR